MPRNGSNAYPHFIGVFDTVAAIANYCSLALVVGLGVLLIAALSGILWFFFGHFWFWVSCLALSSLVIAVVAYLVTHTKVAFCLKEYSWWQTLHFTEARMKFYDEQLNPNVGWARHASGGAENTQRPESRHNSPSRNQISL
jgi:hypothetical protein